MGTSASCSYTRAAPALAFGPQGGPGVGTPSATSCTAATNQTPAAGLPCSTGATGAPPSSSFIGAAPEPAAAPGATIIFSEQDFQHHTGKAMADATAAQVMDMLRKQLTTTNPGGPPGWSAQHIDLSDGRLFDWRSYLVGQGLQTVRCGITAFGAGFIKHVSDPNRLGQDRFDFIAFYADHTVARFHPNRITTKSAAVFYGALDEWSLNGWDAQPPRRRMGASSGGPLLTLAQVCNKNLQHDKLGIKEVQMFVQSCRRQRCKDVDPTRSRWEDLSSGSRFQWWRWISNTGRQAHDIIGSGIMTFLYDHQDDQFVAWHADGSMVSITASRPVHVTVRSAQPGS